MKKPVDLKVSEKEMYGDIAPTSKPGARKVYPYGTRIELNSSLIDKLGLKELPEVGEEINIMAVGEVVAASQSASDGKKSRSVSIQITSMSLECCSDTDKALEKGFKKGRERS